MAARYDRMERKWDRRQETKRDRTEERIIWGWGGSREPVVKWDEKTNKAELKAAKKARHAARNELNATLAAAEQERERRYKGDSEFGAF